MTTDQVRRPDQCGGTAPMVAPPWKGMTMYCTECGTALAGGKFCGSCGAKTNSAPFETDPATTMLIDSHITHAARQRVSPPAVPPPGQVVLPPAAAGAWSDQVVPPGYDAGNVRPQPWPAAERQPAVAWQPGDYARDAGAAVLLIWSLTLPWADAPTASRDVPVLVSALLALVAVAVGPLSRLLRATDGSALRWPTFAIRVGSCVPYAIVVLIAVVRDLAGSGPGLGPSLQLGVLGVALAVVPRWGELGKSGGPVLVHRFRLACAVMGALGMAAMVTTTLVGFSPTRWFSSASGFFLLILPFLVLAAVLVLMFGATALRIGLGRTAWQPTLTWLGVALVVLVVVNEDAVLETSRDPFYGQWLFLISAGLAAVPVLGGKDGSTSEARFWGVVAADALQLTMLGATALLVVFVLVLIQVGEYRSGSQGIVAWILVSVAGTIVAAAVGASRLRGDPAHGRSVALVCIAVIAVLRVIDLAVAGWTPGAGGSSAGTIALFLGTCGVAAFALLVPEPMRGMTDRSAAGGAGPGGVESAPAHVDLSSGQLFAARQPWPEHWQHTPPASTGTHPDIERTVMITGHHADVPLSPVDESRGAWVAEDPTDPAAAAAADPATTAQHLMAIAGSRPDLRPLVAAHPSAYPALLEWLGALGDPAVDSALANRIRHTGGLA